MNKILFLIMIICLSSLVYAAVPTDDVVFWLSWDSDEKNSSHYFDSSPRGINGTISGSPGNPDYILNQGINFTTVGQDIVFDKQTLSEWSVGGMYKWRSVTGNNVMLVAETDTGGSSNYISYQSAFGRIDIYDGSTMSVSTGTLSTNTNYHIVVTCNATNYYVYINGVLNGTTASSGCTHNFEMFGDSGLFSIDFSTKGLHDESFLKNTSISVTEVAEIYNSGSLVNPFDVADTCTCPGLNNDWQVDLSDDCVITSACDLGTGTLAFIGTGTFTCEATIDTTNMLNVSILSASDLFDFSHSSCILNID